MNFLLDTHTFLWTVSESGKLPEEVAQVIKSPKNEIFVSAVTFWEISIKQRIGKLSISGLSIDDLLPIAKKMEFQLIDLTPEDASTYGNLLEKTHRDPFDRMLIWQAINRNLQLISKDSEFDKFIPYGLHLFWK